VSGSRAASLFSSAALRGILAILAIAIGALLLAGWVSESRANEWTLWVIFGLLALSFAFIWGQVGMFSFGQAAFFGIGGYAYAIAGINLADQTGETISAVLISLAVAAAAAAILGYFLIWGNVGDVYLAIITLATSLLLLTIMGSLAGEQYRIGDAALGGYNGVPGVPAIQYGLPGELGTPLTQSQLLAVTFALAALILCGLYWLMRRPFGRVLVGIRENELRAQLLGYDTRRYKLVAFVLGGAIAGLGGAFYAAWGTFINPSVFALSQAALVAIWVLVGGRRSLVGAFAGVILIQALTTELGGSGGTATPLVLGGILIAIVLFLPEGLVPTARGLLAKVIPALRGPPKLPDPRSRPVHAVEASNGRQGARLEAVDLRRTFGGLVALDGVSVSFGARGVHCLIGPNGAGKSTLFNLLVGRHRPSSGEALLDGRSVTRWRPDQRARGGIGIKLQVPSLFAELSAFENVWLAAYSRERDAREATRRAVDTLDWLGLHDRAQRPAGQLSHGDQQWLEIGMVMAQGPRVILLDEPTAGMTREETVRTARLVSQLGEGASVVVVEHDMHFVRELDAPVTLLHEGRVFAEGRIEQLRQDPRILDIYLGRRGNGDIHAEA
jgi:branched-chain amino acid transport system permease protein